MVKLRRIKVKLMYRIVDIFDVFTMDVVFLNNDLPETADTNEAHVGESSAFAQSKHSGRLPNGA